MNKTIEETQFDSSLIARNYTSLQQKLESFIALPPNDQISNATQDTFQDVLYVAVLGVLQASHINAPHSSGGKDSTVDQLHHVVDVFTLCVTYLYAALGVVVFMHACFLFIKKRNKDNYDWFFIILRLAFAVGIALVAMIRTNDNAMNDFLDSPWPIPTTALAIMLCKLSRLSC